MDNEEGFAAVMSAKDVGTFSCSVDYDPCSGFSCQAVAPVPIYLALGACYSHLEYFHKFGSGRLQHTLEQKVRPLKRAGEDFNASNQHRCSGRDTACTNCNSSNVAHCVCLAVGIAPSVEQLEVFSQRPDLQNATFSEILFKFMMEARCSDHYFLCDVEEALTIAEMLDEVDGLGKSAAVSFVVDVFIA